MGRDKRERATHSRFLFLAFLILLCPALSRDVRAQTNQPPPAAEKEVISIDRADELRMLQRGKTQVLVGNVELSQDSIFMYGDSVLLEGEQQVYAYDNVTIQQGDSLTAFCDILDYNAATLLADLRGNVVLTRGETELYTQRLDYDLATKTATYHTGGRIVNQETELSSRHGYYYADAREVYFRDSVVVVDERFEMRADTLKYDLLNEIVYFLGPTVIRTDTHRIYCESGFYDVANDVAIFSKNAQYKSGTRLAAADTIKYFGEREVYVLEGNAYVADGDNQRATGDKINYFRRDDRYVIEGNAYVRDSLQTVTGDTIDYNALISTYSVAGGRPRVSAPPMIVEADKLNSDPVSGFTTARGNVIYQDTSAQLTIEAENARYNEATGYLKATGGLRGRPLMTTVLENDTLWVAADTLLSYRSDSVNAGGDTIRYLAAYKDVRILKSDLQAVCDSLGFNTVDSVLTLYQNPVLWQDTSQMTGDTIAILFDGEELDRVQLRRNALVLTGPDLLFYNQVKGKDIVAIFDSSGLVRTDVNGNAEAVYYIQDKVGAYVGVNKTACSAMSLNFENGSVRKIRFLDAPSGKMDPMGAVNHQSIRVEGFRWEERRRPLRLEDLFSVLKREAPPVIDDEAPLIEEK
ncbi:OstA-like protein [Neolewinella antarctica]|uniref:Lipopolysaccharide export system protein LptA n=1 Tax=Neolewinella antarctica TaxID=442734 RepID=A0ABX0XCT4_9BACT|nr:OstA-like protein [Neolewinella antarctica]NJC26597.1 lipopolysaccharide export system protein LptA [Neolewinella antarctica]